MHFIKFTQTTLMNSMKETGKTKEMKWLKSYVRLKQTTMHHLLKNIMTIANNFGRNLEMFQANQKQNKAQSKN